MSEQKKEVAMRNDVGSQVIKRVDELCSVGFTMPKDYNYVNAIKASMLTLQEVKDRNGQPALSVCTAASIQQALFQMASAGLDVSRKQAYFVARGDKLCLHESYFGKITRVKRIYPKFDPQPRVIHEGDVFVYDTDAKTGRRILVKHVQKIENLDNDFIGAYMYIPCADGGQDLYIMSKKMILAAWAKSSNKNLTTHKEFAEKMCQKTIINSACNMIINSTPELLSPDEDFNDTPEVNTIEDADYEQVDFDGAPSVDVEQEAQPQMAAEPEAPSQAADDDF